MQQTLKDLMRKAGITQSQLADELGFHQTLISQWQIGKTKPSITVLSKMAKLLKVKVDVLVKCFDQK